MDPLPSVQRRRSRSERHGSTVPVASRTPRNRNNANGNQEQEVLQHKQRPPVQGDNRQAQGSRRGARPTGDQGHRSRQNSPICDLRERINESRDVRDNGSETATGSRPSPRTLPIISTQRISNPRISRNSMGSKIRDSGFVVIPSLSKSLAAPTPPRPSTSRWPWNPCHSHGSKFSSRTPSKCLRRQPPGLHDLRRYET